MDVVDQAASQPSFAIVALNLARVSSRDKFVIMVLQIRREAPLSVCLNTRRTASHTMAPHHMLSGKTAYLSQAQVS